MKKQSHNGYEALFFFYFKLELYEGTCTKKVLKRLLVIITQDTRKNKDEFPVSFIQGSWEGFWWAFVSMTTVG